MEDWFKGTTTASPSAPTTLTLDDIRKAVEVFNSLPPEPFGQWMTESGKPPEDGYELHLPVHLKQHFPNVPHYVKFSRAVHAPAILPSFDITKFNYIRDTHG